MKLRITASPLLLLAALFIGCGGHGHMRQLERLEAQLDTAPSVVRLALDSIPFASLGDEERALYAILRTQADYKCYVPLTTDTLIRHATDNYNRNRKSYRAAMAWYSLGCVYTELSDDAAAIGAYLRAQTLFPDTTVRYYAVCNHNLGRHYLNRRILDDAYSSFRQCKQWAVLKSDSATVGYCDYYIGLIYLYEEQHKESDDCFSSVIANRHSASSILPRAYLHLAKSECYIRKNYNLSMEYLDKETSLESNPIDLGANYCVRADIYMNRDIVDSSYIYTMRSLACLPELHTACRNHFRMTLLSHRMGFPTDSVDYHLSRYTMLLDSIHKQRRLTEINDIRIDHSIALMEQELRTEHTRWIFIIAIGFILFIAIVILLAIDIDRRRKSRYISLIHKLRANKLKLWESVSPSSNEAVSIDTCATLAEHIALDLAMCVELYARTSSCSNLQKLNKERAPEFSAEERQAARNEIKVAFMDVIDDLRQASPKLNENEHLYCILKSMGYSTRLIAALLLRTESGLRNNKARIKEKLPKDIYHIFLDRKDK